MEEIAQGQVPVTEGAPAPKPVDFTNVPALTDADVRSAIVAAEKEGIDPNALSVTEMAEFRNENPPKADDSQRMSPDQAFNPNAVKLEVPDQFKNKDGEADVEKIKDATKQLDEAIQNKEQKIAKTAEDYLREYKEKQSKFRNLPNPEKMGERLRAQDPAPQQDISEEKLRKMIEYDYQVDPLGTIARLAEGIASRKLEPIMEEKRERTLRSNVDSLAKEDPRILDEKIFKAVNAELDANPKLWELDNPHEFAWLKVKERLRLGEPPRVVQAQPSRPPSPVLGVGAPPSAPSPLGQRQARSVIETLDVRDKKQEAEGDRLMRQALERRTY